MILTLNCVVFLLLKTSPKLIEKIVGTKREDFQKEWFDNFQWLAYNQEIKKAFCKVCADLATESEKKQSPFANETLASSNWKKGMEKLKEHDASELHKKWMKKV